MIPPGVQGSAGERQDYYNCDDDSEIKSWPVGFRSRREGRTRRRGRRHRWALDFRDDLTERGINRYPLGCLAGLPILAGGVTYMISQAVQLLGLLIGAKG
jgi:hypothetical protein